MLMKIKKTILHKAINECNITDEHKKKLLINITEVDGDTVDIYSENIPLILLSFLLKEAPGLSSSLKGKLSSALIEHNSTDIIVDNVEEIWNSRVKTLGDIVERFSRIGTKKINADLFFNKRWYPVRMIPSFNNSTRYREAYVSIDIEVKFMDEEFNLGWNIYTSDFKNEYGRMKNISLGDLFSEYGCRHQSLDLIKYDENLLKASKLQKASSKQILFNGNALSNAKYNRSTVSSKKLGTTSNKERVIIEDSLEYNESNGVREKSNNKNATYLPYIRIFSMSKKEYLFVDIEDLTEYKYDDNAINKLFLPKKIKSILKKVFSASKDELYSDIVSGKHGGLIIMAWGKPGIGKTSTAEVYSELLQTSLYLLDISELGTSSSNVEGNLSVIFRRVEKWNSIILFDEVDVYLSKRDNDLERSAIVGIFLRLMDYFQGIMFFTTNRPEVIDEAIHSRITMNIPYPDLSEEVRKMIWKEKLNSASIKVSDGIDKLSKIELNGREIRNAVRLIKIILDKNTTQTKIIDLMESTRFNEVSKSKY